MHRITLVNLLLLILFLLGVACGDPHKQELKQNHNQEHTTHLLEKIRQHQNKIKYDVPNTAGLDTSNLLVVHANLANVADFLTEKRTINLASFPCSNCHSLSMDKLQSRPASNIRKAHWDIHLIHANESTMNCITCHAKNDMNQLTSLTKEHITMDESYKLCGQCHSTQYKDWQGGAHGKQLNGWKPPRVAQTCVSCHNPHQPAFTKRFPARLNTQSLGK